MTTPDSPKPSPFHWDLLVKFTAEEAVGMIERGEASIDSQLGFAILCEAVVLPRMLDLN